MSKNILYVLGGLVLVGILAFAYYAISPLFITIKVDEALPEALPESPVGEAVEKVKDGAVANKPTEKPLRAAIIDTPTHPASGFVRIVEAGEKAYVRYEDYKTINGPDIYVYLAKDIEAKEFVDLGKVKATEGNINYEVPSHIDISAYPYVLTWCKQFGVLFNYADVSQAR